MPDQSALDSRYFIDGKRYNCPYCNRGSVSYHITGAGVFDWSDATQVHIIFIKCASCGKVSMHLSREGITIYHGNSRYSFKDDIDIDDHLFYSVPTSFHVIDERIPRKIRELLDEAQGCVKSNFLTGASACVRKVVYEVAVRERATGDTYEDRIKSLKAKLPNIDPSYFDTLLSIQKITSDKVHEESYDGWTSKHLRLILATLLEIMGELYVIPALRDERRKQILAMQQEVLGSGAKTLSPGTKKE